MSILTVGTGAVLAANGTGAEQTDQQTIAVTGSAEIDAEPDAAVVQLAVTARGPDAGNVSDQVAAGASGLRAALDSYGVPDENVQTQRYVIHEDRRSEDRAGETSYVGEQTFEVTVEDVDEVGQLIDAAVDGGADNVGGVHYTLSDERQDQIRDQALNGAIESARSEAGVIAEATDLRIEGVQRVISGDTGVRPYRAEVSAASLDGGGGTAIDPQDVTVTATVEVTFAAADN